MSNSEGANDQLDVGLDLDSTQDPFSSGSLFNPTQSEPTSTDKMEEGSASEQPDSGISEPPPLTDLEAVDATLVAPPVAMAVTTAQGSTQTDELPQEWLGPLIANDDNSEHELVVNVENGVESKLTELIAAAKSAGKVLVCNGQVVKASGGMDRVRFLSQSVLASLAQNAEILHTREFCEGETMRQVLATCQTLYCKDAKYANIAQFLVKTNLETARKRQETYRRGAKTTAPIVIDDSPPPGAKSAPLGITRTVENSVAACAPTASAGGAQATAASETTPWSAPPANSGGWDAPGSSTSAWTTPNWPLTTPNSSSNRPSPWPLVQPANGPAYYDLSTESQTTVDIRDLRRQVAALEQVIRDGDQRDGRPYRGRGGQRGGFGYAHGRGAPRGTFGSAPGRNGQRGGFGTARGRR
jgi:hypothetical protein